ncbi:DUF1501 domain-containing protein [Alisedimentitalea sp. MJ-SS2]|uniref:DUF1501 domain-containing protein n=1 Tax=Aliisedimentitalea sp. MJ-SS2 TaxID=3049795 RepID=UPI002914FE43|nr:DUF1501 domain-containing protein [Alisedimentitalea sp. MJ-SS2]MDU8927435.1 DUF1501 domain-containing protein [Alisedimentitalea sp. MJ-SS2]
MLSRRRFLQTTTGGLVTSLAASGASFASAPTDNRLIFVFLRGGLDGLHTLAPFADPDYHRLRPVIGLEASQAGTDGPGAVSLDGYFGLNKALAPLLPLYQAGELSFLPATATRYRSRSHFDGQNMLENGSGQPYGADDGWLNRAILGLNAGDHRLGLALGPAVPLILQGQAEVQTWDDSALPEVDDDFLVRLMQMYRSDPLFLDTLHDATGALKPDVNMTDFGNLPRLGRNFSLSARVAADLLAHAQGPRIAVMELGGWDTHFGQDNRLRRLLGFVSEGLLELKRGLAENWNRTTVVVVSEFGRTAAENASRGTDHGTGGIAMLAGGAVAGGRIAGDWPGLTTKALYKERDLRPVNSLESLFKTLLVGHLGLDQGFVEDRVFPGSVALQPMDGLLRKI